MDKIVFTEEFCQPENLHPFTLTRQIQDIRVGILTIREKWERMLGLPSFDKNEDDYKDLSRSVNIEDITADGSTCIMIHGNVLPTPALVDAVKTLRNGQFITINDTGGIIFRFCSAEVEDRNRVRVREAVHFSGDVPVIRFPWDIIKLNDRALRDDFELITGGRVSGPLASTNRCNNPGQVFIEPGAKVEYAIINAETGPVYIGKDAEVMEGAIIRGPFAMGEGAVVKMGAKIYGATTLGPGCIGGGEIKNTVMFGFSNKAHDGYLGDSVIGEWCNLGAGTSNSNLKNNLSDVTIWTRNGKMNAGKKCGVMMGDYTRTAINTSINTGTVIGACCNVFGASLTPKYIPSFSWGFDGTTSYGLERAITDIRAWKQLKNRELSADEEKILNFIFDKI